MSEDWIRKEICAEKQLHATNEALADASRKLIEAQQVSASEENTRNDVWLLLLVLVCRLQRSGNAKCS